MTTADADAEAKRRFGPTGYARPSLGMFCVAQVEPFAAVAYGATYEDAFAWAAGGRPAWWYAQPTVQR